MTQQLYEQWFRIADADKDGAVGGGEAVSFFMRSGLPQGVLGQASSSWAMRWLPSMGAFGSPLPKQVCPPCAYHLSRFGNLHQEEGPS